jgi:hypothetical protein
MTPVARYLILGAGKFGRLALERLANQEPAAAFTVVDRQPEALAAAQTLGISGVEWLPGEAVAFLVAHLKPQAPWDWLVPMVPVHLAAAWLLRGPLRGWETVPVPEAVGTLARVWSRGAEGQLYLSRAAHLCPDDCPESESLCPVSGESREVPLAVELAALPVPGWHSAVITSRQLAPGVGGYPPGELLALGRDLAGRPGRILLATACRCHGVVHGLKKTDDRGRETGARLV